jgi:hypothetical protein
MIEKTISEFLSNEYKEFAMYTIESRAIPSVIDGFKPSQRKVIHVSNQIWKSGNEKTLKIFQRNLFLQYKNLFIKIIEKKIINNKKKYLFLLQTIKNVSHSNCSICSFGYFSRCSFNVQLLLKTKYV